MFLSSRRRRNILSRDADMASCRIAPSLPPAIRLAVPLSGRRISGSLVPESPVADELTAADFYPSFLTSF
jgi:hypothetical protein